MKQIKKLFKKQNLDKPINEPYRQIKLEDEKPPNEVVLAAVDSTDCGQVMDSSLMKIILIKYFMVLIYFHLMMLMKQIVNK